MPDRGGARGTIVMDLHTHRAADSHRSLHSDTAGLPGEHPGRSRNPVVKVAGLAWLEFEKPDLARAERFLTDFGLVVADRTPQALVLRGHWAGTPAARRSAQIQRLGHVVFGTTRFRATLCTPPTSSPTWMKVAAAGEYLRERGYRHSWGIGRHIQGSQIFDYWRDPDRLMFEHYTDGDLFDCSMRPGWAPMSASGLSQWGPTATAEFTGAREPGVLLAAIKALTDKGNEIDFAALRGLVKAMAS
jgi:hypothetical protein